MTIFKSRRTGNGNCAPHDPEHGAYFAYQGGAGPWQIPYEMSTENALPEIKDLGRADRFEGMVESIP